MRIPPIGKTLLSWLAVVSGAVLGFFELAIFGMEWAPFGDRSSGWFLRWFSIAGMGLLGVCFIAGSIVAARNRRFAGLIFLIFMPVAAFFLADPDAGFLVWHADGGGWFETPPLSTGIGLTVLFFAPFVSILLARRHRKRAAYLLAIAASLAGLVFAMSRWTKVLVPRLAGWSAPFLLFGLFWLGTHQLGWSPMFEARTRSRLMRTATIAAGFLAIVVLDLAVTLGLAAARTSLFSPDCGGRKLFTKPVFAGHAVFTTRLIRVHHSQKVAGKWLGDWAVGIVRRQYWGLPAWEPHVILLTNGIFWEGETYFIDGDRSHGLLTQFLPLVEAGPCARSKPLVDADIELRMLREGPPANGTRIVGYTQGPEPYRAYQEPPKARPGLSGAHILLHSSSGTKVITTDADGVYQIDGLPPDNYALKLELPDTQYAPEQNVAIEETTRLAIVERDFYVGWNGTVEGTIRDKAGGPASVSMQLEGPNGTDLSVPIIQAESGRDGSFRIKGIPPGRYTLVANSFGPQHESPYAPLYYPSALRREDARVFELARGEHLKNMDYSLQRLTERKLRIRFTTADGQPVKDPWFWVIYEHDWYYYRNPLGGGGILKTNDDGNSEISVFGDDLRLWIFAEVFPAPLFGSVSDNSNAANNRLSAPTALRGSNLPSHLDLKLNVSESQFTGVWSRITSAKNSEEKR